MKKIIVCSVLSAIVLAFTSCAEFSRRISHSDSHDIALVLSGGGAKGAYQIGVWKALDEYHVSERISVVSGTSVGSLNAALFAAGDYEAARNLWNNEVGFYSFLMPNLNNLSDIVSYVQNI